MRKRRKNIIGLGGNVYAIHPQGVLPLHAGMMPRPCWIYAQSKWKGDRGFAVAWPQVQDCLRWAGEWRIPVDGAYMRWKDWAPLKPFESLLEQGEVRSVIVREHQKAEVADGRWPGLLDTCKRLHIPVWICHGNQYQRADGTIYCIPDPVDYDDLVPVWEEEDD